MRIEYLRDIDPSLKVIEHNGTYFSYSNTEIYLYDPATEAHNFAEDFPLYNQNETSNFFFLLNNRLFFRKGVNTLISFDTTF